MKKRNSPAEVAVMVWMSSALAAGLVLAFSGGREVWAAVIGAVPAAVAFWATGGFDAPADEDVSLADFTRRSREVREIYAKPRSPADPDAGPR